MKKTHKETIHMPFVAATVIIPDAIRPILSKFAKSRTFSARQVQRAKIILLAADGLDNMQISNRAGFCQQMAQPLYQKAPSFAGGCQKRPFRPGESCLRLPE